MMIGKEVDEYANDANLRRVISNLELRISNYKLKSVFLLIFIIND